MRKALINLSFILYMMQSIGFGMAAILYPFTLGHEDAPLWIGWIIFPITLLNMSTSDQIIEWFWKRLFP